MKKNIVYVGNFHFPNGNAAGKRVSGNVDILVSAGYSVTIIDTSDSIDDSSIDKGKGTSVYRYSLPYPKGMSGWIKFQKTYKKVVKIIEEIKTYDDVQAVIMYGSPVLSVFCGKLIKYCKRNKISIYSDCVDWLDVKTNNLFRDLIKKIDDNYQKRVSNVKCDGVICISSYLANFYKSKGCKTVIIPPIINDKNNDVFLSDSEVTSFIYAGRPFRNDMSVDDVEALKDRIDILFGLFSKIKLEGFNFKLNIYGFEKEEVLNCLPLLSNILDIISDNVVFHGMVSNDTVLSNLKESDFSVLIRDEKRDTVAGFPSKVAESVANGTPVVVTNTGDIDVYLKEGVNAFICDPSNTESQMFALRKAACMSKQERNSLKKNCIKSNPFEPELYRSQLIDFLISEQS